METTLDDTTGDGEQLRLLGREAEALDDERGEAAPGSVGDVHGCDDDGNEVRLRVDEHLAELLLFEPLVLDAGLVLAQPLDRADLLGVAEPGGYGVVGQESNHRDAHDDRDEPEDEEQQLPRAERVGGVEQQAVGDEAAHDGGGAGANVPGGHADGLF